MSPAKSLPLLRNTISLSEALGRDDDILRKLSLPVKRDAFYIHLYKNRKGLEAIVAFHLGLPPTVCEVLPFIDWVVGSFNLCVPVKICELISDRLPRTGRVFLRFPLPYTNGDDYSPGNSEEKLRCELATYIWIREHCPDLRTPQLYGFGFPDGYCFTAPEQVAPLARFLDWLRRQTYIIQNSLPPCCYTRRWRKSTFTLQTGYMLIEDVKDANNQMLSQIWEDGYGDAERRGNLFRDLSRIMLQLSNTPFAAIGSLTIDSYGIVAQRNRPLLLELLQLENENIKTHIPRTLTYSSSTEYFLDLIACHESRLRTHRNPVHNKIDGYNQIGAIMMMKTFIGSFIGQQYRHGPFLLSLTDLHASNIFVDAEWHITHIIDLEWACTLPVEMISPPLCLTKYKIDELDTEERFNEYSARHAEFLDIFKSEEAKISLSKSSAPMQLTEIMKEGWKNQTTYWCLNGLRCLYTGPVNLFLQHLYPPDLDMTEFRRVLPQFWNVDVERILDERMLQKKRYEEELRAAFEDGGDDISGVCG